MALIGNFRSQMLWDNIRKSDLTAVVNLLENGTINLEERDENGQTFLMVACQQGEVSLVRELLDAGMDPNGIDNDNWSALLYAAKDGHLEIVIELLEREADIDHRDLCNWSALMWASYKGHETVVEELLDRGADPNIKAEHNMSCLCWAAGRGHTKVVKALLQKGAKVNSTDKYGTSPLIWAARKGHLEVVQDLLNEGANCDYTGMDSLTALLVATKGGHTEVVTALLEHDPNVNATDKDGFTALTIATKEGFEDIVLELLAKDAYVNIADRVNDTILIHAVKGGYTNMVRALLNRYADVDVEGCDRKTALYWAVEKGHTEIVKLLLDNDADVEITNKDGDSPLMRAVRNRFETIVRLLLDKGAKVHVFDKKGDSALHISLRARSKRITELLLRNPRNSRLLYRPNKAGETPYSIDAYHQKGILTQIHGHRQLNASDGENLLGYEIYSSSLADILSEPSLNTPITTGLYAKWGSGKSFLIGKLKDEMKQFTKSNEENQLSFTWSLFIFLLLLNSLIGSILALGLSERWQIGVGTGLGLFLWEYGFLGIIWICSTRYNTRFARRINQAIGKRLVKLTLLLQVLYCNPIAKSTSSTDVPLVKFLFSENTKLTSVGGEKALAAMVAGLSESLELEFGTMAARLYGVLKQMSNKKFIGRFKTACCIPVFVIVVFVLLCFVTGISLLVIYKVSDNEVVNGLMIGFGGVVATTLLVNIRVIYRMIIALTLSQKFRIMRAADKMHQIKLDGFMQVLKREVNLMNSLVTTMDKFTSNTTRLVVVVDGLDTCEQEKVLQVLDIIHSLFNEENSPFVVILAVDPQIIIKGIDQNLKSSLADTMVNGFDYLRNIVHLPFYLQSQGLQVKQQKMMKSVSTFDVGHESPTHNNKAYRHQESILSSASDSHARKGRKHHRQHLDSLTQVTHSNFDIHHTLTKNNYFSDVNPKSMRRLMNIVAVTGRLLRAYNIDFNWYRLAAWVNLIEQWPYRMSWIILYFEEHDDLNDELTLRFIYDKVVSQMPVSSEVEPLLEIDRNVRKLEAFLSSKSSSSPMLNIADLKLFLPCTINLDPYLRKLIRNLQQQMLSPEMAMGMFTPPANPIGPRNIGNLDNQDVTRVPHRMPRVASNPMLVNMQQGNMMPYGPMGMVTPPMMGMNPYMYGMGNYQPPEQLAKSKETPKEKPVDPKLYIKGYVGEVLSEMTTEAVSSLLGRIDKLNPLQLRKYQQAVMENNINGLVLSQCDLDQLGSCLNMKFGDWQLFRSAILAVRDYPQQKDEIDGKRQNRPAASSFKKLRGEPSRRSIHFSESDSSFPKLTYQDTIQPTDSGSIYTQQSSTDTQAGTSDTASNFDIIPEDDELPSDQEPQSKIQRQDSIVAEMIYESAIVNEFMHNFTEISEGEDQDMFDSNEDEEDTDSLKQYGLPPSRNRMLPVQFTLNSYDGDMSDEQSDNESPLNEREPLIVEHEQRYSPDDKAVPLLRMPKLSQLSDTAWSEPSIPQAIDEDSKPKNIAMSELGQKSCSTSSSGFPNFPSEARVKSEESLNTLAVIDETEPTSLRSQQALQQGQEQYAMTDMPSGTRSETSVITGNVKDKKSKTPEEYV